jgi:integrase
MLGKDAERAGIKGFRVHVLRHTWASWHIMICTPLHVLQELGRWSSIQMVQCYAHLSHSHLREHAENVASSVRFC